MRDPDELMAYEARQQELIEGILRSLHKAADEVADSDYLAVFRPLARGLLLQLCEEQVTDATSTERIKRLLLELVNRPIMDFIGREKLEGRFVEYRYLQLKVFEKVVAAIASRIIAEYHRLELGF